MVLFPRGVNKGDRSLDERWVEKGRTAKERTMTLDEWSDRETARWDLDDADREPTGVENPRTWTYRKPLLDVNKPGPGKETRRDVRDNPGIGEHD